MSVSGPPARRLPGLATPATWPVRPAWPADDGSHLRHSAPAARKLVLPRWDDQPEGSCDRYILPHAFPECKDVGQAAWPVVPIRRTQQETGQEACPTACPASSV